MASDVQKMKLDLLLIEEMEDRLRNDKLALINQIIEAEAQQSLATLSVQEYNTCRSALFNELFAMGFVKTRVNNSVARP